LIKIKTISELSSLKISEHVAVTCCNQNIVAVRCGTADILSSLAEGGGAAAGAAGAAAPVLAENHKGICLNSCPEVQI
jgi:hypothetical protein